MRSDQVIRSRTMSQSQMPTCPASTAMRKHCSLLRSAASAWRCCSISRALTTMGAVSRASSAARARSSRVWWRPERPMKRVRAPTSSKRLRIGTVIIERKPSARSNARWASLSATLRYQASSTSGCRPASPVDRPQRFKSRRCCRTQRVGASRASVSGASWAATVRSTPSPCTTSKKPKSPSAGRQALMVWRRVSPKSPAEASTRAAKPKA